MKKIDSIYFSARLILLLASTASVALTTAAGAQSVRIGGIFSHAPSGIAFVKDDAAAFVLDPGGSFNAGIVAPDDSYHKVFLEHDIEFTWSRVGDSVVARLEAGEPAKLTFRLDENWPDLVSHYSVSADGVTGVAETHAGKVTWMVRTQPAPDAADEKSITLALGGVGKPVYLVAGFGSLTSFDRIDAILAEKQAAYEKRRPKSDGPSGDIVGAITNNINNSRVYSTDNKMAPVVVSRTFGDGGPNEAPYFEWDSFFNALLASLDNPELARETVRAMFSGQTPEGLVPNFTHWSFRGLRTSADRSEPPVGAMCIWKMNLRQPDTAFLREVYPKLVLWHQWWLKDRQNKNNGLLSWGSDYEGPDASTQEPLWETGWDDTPAFKGYPGVKRVGRLLNVYAVDLNSLWAVDAQYLALIADVIGNKDDASVYRQQAVDMNKRINARLWNEELGVYCNRFFEDEDGKPGKFLTRITPANFYPLISGAATPAQAKRVLAIMTDPEQFWGEWILPTVSFKDPLFLQQRYWHGTIWGPVNYLVFQGVKRYGSPELQAEFAQKSVHIFMNNWLGSGQCGENFLSTTGRVGGNPNYTWGALMALIGVESVIDIDDQGLPQKGAGFNEPIVLKNIPIGGKPYNAIAHYGDRTTTVQSVVR